MQDISDLLMRASTKVKQQLDNLKSAFEDFKDLDFRIFEHMPVGICLTDEDGIFTDANSAYLDIYGFTREEIIGKHFSVVVPEQEQTEVEEAHHRFFQQTQKKAELFTVKDHNGEEFEIFAHSTRIDIDNNQWRLMSFIAPIDELPNTVERMTSSLVLMEKRIKAQNNAVDLSDHQMRNSLGSIITVASMLKKSDLNEMQTKWVEFIEGAGHRTLGILETTRDFVQMEMGEFRPRYEKLDVMDTFEKINKELRDLTTFKQSKISITIEGQKHKPDTKLNIEADPTYVNHLFSNLLTNAIEASPDGSEVNIDIRSEETLKISIKNQGCVPAHIQPRFFEKYVSAGKSNGTGLGTYIAKLIAQAHQGDIDYTTSEKDGTELTVSLPFTAAELN